MEQVRLDNQVKFKLELTVIITINLLGIVAVIAGASLLLTNVGIAKYVAATLGILSGGLLGSLALRYYSLFAALTRLMQIALIVFVLWGVFFNEVSPVVVVALFPATFLYTSLSFNKHWAKIKASLSR